MSIEIYAPSHSVEAHSWAWVVRCMHLVIQWSWVVVYGDLLIDGQLTRPRWGGTQEQTLNFSMHPPLFSGQFYNF